jgi:hypothetical protein
MGLSGSRRDCAPPAADIAKVRLRHASGEYRRNHGGQDDHNPAFPRQEGSISPSAVPVNEPGVTPDIIQSAIDSLTVAGVIHRDPDGDLRASAALVELDALRMICV